MRCLVHLRTYRFVTPLRFRSWTCGCCSSVNICVSAFLSSCCISAWFCHFTPVLDMHVFRTLHSSVGHVLRSLHTIFCILTRSSILHSTYTFLPGFGFLIRCSTTGSVYLLHLLAAFIHLWTSRSRSGILLFCCLQILPPFFCTATVWFAILRFLCITWITCSYAMPLFFQDATTSHGLRLRPVHFTHAGWTPTPLCVSGSRSHT